MTIPTITDTAYQKVFPVLDLVTASIYSRGFRTWDMLLSMISSFGIKAQEKIFAMVWWNALKNARQIFRFMIATFFKTEFQKLENKIRIIDFELSGCGFLGNNAIESNFLTRLPTQYH